MMLGMHLIPLTEALEVVRRVDFMLCIFYHQKEKEMEENIKHCASLKENRFQIK